MPTETPQSRLGLEPPREDPSAYHLISRYTRNWVHYGWFGFTLICCLTAAVKGLLAR